MIPTTNPNMIRNPAPHTSPTRVLLATGLLKETRNYDSKTTPFLENKFVITQS